jgi:hypothetical protein
MIQRLRERFGDLISLDLRSLAVLRIGLGLMLLADLFVRAEDLSAHYTDVGVLPCQAVFSSVLSLHLMHGSWWFEAGLFVVAAVFALALVVGFHTRLAAFCSCLLLISLHARNPIVLHGGDNLLRVLLFWGVFLPLEECFSIDSLLRPSGPRPHPRVASVATAALILQVCFVYWFSVLLKSDPVWRTEGTAVYYALSIEQFATPWGRQLLGYPDLLRLLTFATLGIEAIGPALLFLPWGRGPIRTLVVAAFVGFHLFGLGLALELGNFPYVCAVAWLALLPSWFWDRLGRLASKGNPLPAVAAGVRASVWHEALAGFFLVYVFLWNLRTLDQQRFQCIFPVQVNGIGVAVGLDQMWNLFAPYPLKDDGWYVIVGTLADGRQVDLFRDGQPVRWEKPELISAMYKNARWRKYLMNLWRKDHADHRLRYARYLCRDWNECHGASEQVESIEMYFMLKVTQPNYQPSTPQKVLLCTYCSPQKVAGSPANGPNFGESVTRTCGAAVRCVPATPNAPCTRQAWRRLAARRSARRTAARHRRAAFPIPTSPPSDDGAGAAVLAAWCRGRPVAPG